MINGLKPYPAYKDSGVEWLGKVPAHWEIRSLGSLTSPISQRGQPDLPLLSVVREKGVIPRTSMSEDENHNFVPDDLSNYKVVRKGNLVINKMKAWQGSLGIASMDGIVSPAYFVFDFRIGDQRFGQGLLRSKTYVAFFSQESDGVRIGQWDLSIHGMKRIPVVVPPLSEQTAIVRFLDWAERRMRRYIRAKQKLINLVEEYKQALIHQAVTGRIDVRTGKPYPAYKDSGVEWLGKVPAHWDVRRLKRVARLNPSKSEVPASGRDELAVFLPMERVGSDGRFDASYVRPIRELWNGFTYFRRGDVIIAKITPCFENGKGACLQTLPTEIGFGSTEFHVVRPSKEAIASYVYRVTMLTDFRQLGADAMTGAAGQQRVPSEFVANFPMPLPPLIEQTAIVEYLDNQTAKLDAAMAATRREIDLLREYRERLIADVVTGKVDVREVAAQLPEEPLENEEAATAEAEDEILKEERDAEA